jgi:hypothetical protein
MKEDFEYSDIFKPIKESEIEQWKPQPKSFITRLFQQFLDSTDKMVEVNLEQLPSPKPRGKGIKSTKQDSFASSFYAWKRKNKGYLKSLGIDVLLYRRGERIALRKKKLNR